MPGYTKQQLDAKGRNITNYKLCESCRLYWHKRGFDKHLVAAANTHATGPALSKRDPCRRPIVLIHPALERFVDFLVETAIRSIMEESADKIARGEPVDVDASEPTVLERTPSPSTEEPELVTVDEAVKRFGLAREEILAEFERNIVPFEVELRSPTRGARARQS
jgi:hypothetical protein